MSPSDLLGNIVLGGGLAFGAAVQPGPLQAFLVSRVLAAGWKKTVPACFAPLVSDGPIAVVAVLLVGHVPSAGLHVLRAGGGLLLLYLAAKALRQWQHPAPASLGVSAPRTFVEAVMVNLLNPNPYLGWALVLGPTTLDAWRRNPLYAVAFVAAFYATMFATLAGFVFLAGTARFLTPARQRALVGASAFILAGLGLFLLGVSARGLWAGP